MLTQRMHYCANRGALTGRRPESACSSCRQSAACGSALLARLQNTRTELTLASAECDQPEDGEEFTVSLPARTLLRLCATVFPGLSVSLVAGASLFEQWFAAWGEPAALAGASTGLIVGVLMLRLYDSRFGSRASEHRLLVVPSGRVLNSDS